MIKNYKIFSEFERNLIRNEKVDFKRNLKLVDAMYQEAVALGVFPPKNPLEGIETKIKLAQVLNSVRKTNR
ncbi:MAG: hypothetical protein ACE14V_10805 [bacterium]